MISNNTLNYNKKINGFATNTHPYFNNTLKLRISINTLKQTKSKNDIENILINKKLKFFILTKKYTPTFC